MLPGTVEQLMFVDAPAHARDLIQYPRARGYHMAGNRIGPAKGGSIKTVGVHPPAVHTVNMAGVTAKYRWSRPLPVA